LTFPILRGDIIFQTIHNIVSVKVQGSGKLKQIIKSVFFVAL
jgi:hypothetical protein